MENASDPTYKRRKPGLFGNDSGESFFSFLFEVLEVILLSAILFLAIRSVVQNFRIEGESMEPNFHNGQYLMVNRWAYCPGLYVDLDISWQGRALASWHVDRHVCKWKPQRGDVIVFRYPYNPRRDYIKRVIGLPGETVSIRNGVVYINGHRLVENFRYHHAHYNAGPVKLGPHEYYVLGDNRPFSSDSHEWGPLQDRYIIGKALLSYWPPKYVGIVPHYRLVVKK